MLLSCIQKGGVIFNRDEFEFMRKAMRARSAETSTSVACRASMHLRIPSELIWKG